jgi:hypothetical protein
MATQAEQIARLDPLDIPNLNEQGLFEYLHKELGIPLGRNTIRTAVQNREIVPTVIARKHLFSRSDGLKWITEQRNKV